MMLGYLESHMCKIDLNLYVAYETLNFQEDNKGESSGFGFVDDFLNPTPTAWKEKKINS